MLNPTIVWSTGSKAEESENSGNQYALFPLAGLKMPDEGCFPNTGKGIHEIQEPPGKVEKVETAGQDNIAKVT